MARKTKYDSDRFPLLAEGLAREGMNDEQICQRLGVSHDSFYKYQKRYPEFAEAIKRGKAPVDIEVENSLLKKAKGFEYEETSTEIKIDEHGNAKPTMIKKTKKLFPPDTGAIALWLKNRKPKEWRDKIDISGDLDLKRYVVKLTDDEE